MTDKFVAERSIVKSLRDPRILPYHLEGVREHAAQIIEDFISGRLSTAPKQPAEPLSAEDVEQARRHAQNNLDALRRIYGLDRNLIPCACRLHIEAGFDDTPVEECGYHATLRARLAQCEEALRKYDRFKQWVAGDSYDGIDLEARDLLIEADEARKAVLSEGAQRGRGSQHERT